MLRLHADSEEELKEKYKQVYIETYIRTASGEEIEIRDWDGARVRFSVRDFEHAFTDNPNFRFGAGVHTFSLSKQRARRVLWIREVLTASAGTIEKRIEYRQTSRGRRRRVVLHVVEESYVVVLGDRAEGDKQFITAFHAGKNYREKVLRKTALVEPKKKPQS
jgi:hypothetical protein